MADDGDRDFFAVIGLLLIVPVVFVGGMLIRGWALSVMWDWFIVPTFYLPSLRIPAAIGVAIIVSFLTRTYPTEPKEKKKLTFGESVMDTICKTFIAPLAIVGIGWIVNLWM